MKIFGDQALSWAFTWIIGIWVYGWPFIVLHGIARVVVGILWLAAALLVTVLIGLARQNSHKSPSARGSRR